MKLNNYITEFSGKLNDTVDDRYHVGIAITFFLNAILIVTPFIISPSSIDYFYLPKVLVFSLLTVIIALYWIKTDSRSLLPKDHIEYLLLGYVILLLVSGFFAHDTSRFLWGSVLREEGVLTLIVYFFIFYSAKNKYLYNEKALNVLLIASILISFYGILQFHGFDPIPRDFLRATWRGRSFSTFGNPNFFGTYLVLILPISIFNYIDTRKSLYYIISGILYYTLLSTMTRSTWIGFAVSLIVLIVSIDISQKKRNLLMVFGLIITISLVFDLLNSGILSNRILSISHDAGQLITQAEDYERAGANRIFIWNRVISIIKMYPIWGVGIECLDLVFTDLYGADIIAEYGTMIKFDKAHNEYLHIAVTSGIPSMIVYLSFVSTIVFRAFRSVKKNPLIVPFLCSILGYLTQAFFNVSVVSVAYIYWIFLGILSNLSEDTWGRR